MSKMSLSRSISIQFVKKKFSWKGPMATLIVQSAVAIGCFVQLQTITSNYFRYETKTETLISRGKTIPAPSISLCWRFFDLLDTDKVNQKLNLKSQRPFSRDVINQVRDKLTIKEIFDWTPANKSLITKCFIRNGNSYGSRSESGSKCDTEFKIEKYFHRCFICYRFELKVSTTYSLFQAMYTGNRPGNIFEVTLDPEAFKYGEYFSPTVHLPGSSVLFDASLSYYFHRPVNITSRENSLIKIQNTFFFITTNRMPPPYDTNCIVSDRTNTYKTLSCLEWASFNKFGKVIGGQILTNGSLVAELFTVDEINQNAKELDSMLLNCRKQIKQLACRRYHTSTETDISESEELALTAEWPKNPDFEVTSHPEMEFLELVIYQMSSVGIWLGVSFLSATLFLVEKVRGAIGNDSKLDGTRRKSLRKDRAKLLLQSQFEITNRHEKEIRDIRRILVLSHSLKK